MVDNGSLSYKNEACVPAMGILQWDYYDAGHMYKWNLTWYKELPYENEAYFVIPYNTAGNNELFRKF